MASSANLRIAGLVALGLVTPAALVVACSSSSSNPTPTTPVYNTTGDDAGDATTTEPTEAGNSTPEASTGDAAGGGGTPDAASDAAPACTSALSDAGCYVCPGTTTQFLNQCSATGVQCTGFNNLSRLPSYDGGALAPLN